MSAPKKIEASLYFRWALAQFGEIFRLIWKLLTKPHAFGLFPIDIRKQAIMMDARKYCDIP